MSHTFLTRRNVIFRCHILISTKQTKFLIAPAFIWGANRVNTLSTVYSRAEHILYCNFEFLCYFWILLIRAENKNMYTTSKISTAIEKYRSIFILVMVQSCNIFRTVYLWYNGKNNRNCRYHSLVLLLASLVLFSLSVLFISRLNGWLDMLKRSI